MANSNGLRVGSVTARLFQALQVSPAAINANSLSVETYTLNGLQTDMAVHVNQQAVQAGIVLVHALCDTVNVLKVTWWNATGGSLTPTAAQWLNVVAF